MSFTADFSRYSNYNEQGNAVIVRFAAGTPALETEINELQLIMNTRIRDINKMFGDGLLGAGSILYADGKLTIKNEKAIVDGYMFSISQLNIALANGESAYLDVWLKEVKYNDVMKKGGNEQDVEITNYIVDTRYNKEISRRYVLAFNLVKTTGTAGHSYLKVGTVSSTGSWGVTARQIATSSGGNGESISPFDVVNVVAQEVSQLKRGVSNVEEEIGTISLTNTKRFPFNDSVKTVALKKPRNNLDYTVVVDHATDPMVGTVTVYDKQINGFKIMYEGDASSVTLKYYVKGGIL